MKNSILLLFACSLLAAACTQNPKSTAVKRIAFGSCGNQDKPWTVLNVALKYQPDYFIFLGDNIYGDSRTLDTLRAKYARLGAKPEFQRLRQNTKILAIWDDHDYGENDSGRHYPLKDSSKQIFLEFWKEPADSPRRQHTGIYTSHFDKIGDKTLQIILLDNRTFRDDLRYFEKGKPHEALPRDHYFYQLDYLPQLSPDSTMLGEEQWVWLETELKKPADLRLIGSGSQFGIEFNGYEAWANFPHEQQRMLNLIKKTRANGVVFLTGDVHYAEISVLQPPGQYPIYDVTASGITSTWEFATENRNRIEGPVMENHFGLLTIDCSVADPKILMEIIDYRNNRRIEYEIRGSDISFK